MLDKLKNKLPDIQETNFKEADYLNSQLEAAVLVAFTDKVDDPEIILTQRSQIMRAHAGEVALPGGKIERIDTNYIETALRESQEEVGLHPNDVEVLGQIDAKVSRQGVKVQPIVGFIDHKLELTAKSNELDAVFKVPVSVFYDDRSRIIHCFNFEGETMEISAFRYNEFTIWGLTASIIIDVLNLVHDEKITNPTLRFKSTT